MKTLDFGIYILSYNFVIGLLLMIASEKLGVYAGYFTGSAKAKISRLTQIGTITFGACVAVLMVGTYLAGYVLKL